MSAIIAGSRVSHHHNARRYIVEPGRPGERDRVSHLNRGTGQSYGTGEVTKVLQVLGGLRPPSKAYVRFDGEAADRLVWLDDLTVIVTPAPMPGSAGQARFCWPPERAGQPVDMTPGAA